MKRPIALAVVALLMLGLVPSPAVAANKVYLLPEGVAEVSKTPFFGEAQCERTDDPTGGLGLPIVTGVKKGYWRLEASLINATTLTPAGLEACGKLNPVARRLTGEVTPDNPDDGGIGAACGMSKGYDGRGVIQDDTKDVVIGIRDIQWKFSAAGHMLVLGQVRWFGIEKGEGKLIAHFHTRAAGCPIKPQVDPADYLEKNPDKEPEGATNFAVNGTLLILQDPAAEAVPKWKDLPGSEEGSQDDPLFCKQGDETDCPVYGPKKQHGED